MRFLDVFGDGRWWANLDQVRLLKTEDRGEKVDVHFVYDGDHESVFAVPSGRFVVLAETFEDMELAA